MNVVPMESLSTTGCVFFVHLSLKAPGGLERGFKDIGGGGSIFVDEVKLTVALR